MSSHSKVDIETNADRKPLEAFADSQHQTDAIPLHHVPSRTSEAPEVSTTRKRRWAILSLCIIAMFIDVLTSSAFFVFTGVIARDLDIVFEQQTWIINAYTVTFASCLLFWGRFSDLYSARPVFSYGFIAFGILSLANSFLVEKFSFFVIRALNGIAAAALVPSAYRLLSSVFPPEEKSLAFTLYSMTGSIANTLGTLIAGLYGSIPAGGQGSGWSVISGVLAILLVPRMPELVASNKFKRLDFLGISCAIVLLIIGLTLGATYGWATPRFIVPLIISACLFPCFFYWETRLPAEYAIIPPSLWRLPNFTVLIVFALLILGAWGVFFLPAIEYYSRVQGETVIIAAVRVLPTGIAAGITSFLLIKLPNLISRPKWPICFALVIVAIGYALWTQAHLVNDYWRFILPGQFLASSGLQVTLLATVVAIMQAAPPEQAGVVGAVLQTSMQTSTVVAIAIQAGLLTVYPNGLDNLANIHLSWYFELGWVLVWLLGFAIFYRQTA